MPFLSFFSHLWGKDLIKEHISVKLDPTFTLFTPTSGEPRSVAFSGWESLRKAGTGKWEALNSEFYLGNQETILEVSTLAIILKSLLLRMESKNCQFIIFFHVFSHIFFSVTYEMFLMTPPPNSSVSRSCSKCSPGRQDLDVGLKCSCCPYFGHSQSDPNHLVKPDKWSRF